VVTRVNFDDLPAGTSVTTQYAARGVLFEGELIVLAPGAPSGTNVLEARGPLDDVNPVTTIHMRFTSGLTRVRVRAGVVSGGARHATLQVFDAHDHMLMSDGPRNVTQDQFTTVFGVNVASAVITRAELHMDGSGAAIDDVELDGDAPAELPTTPPTIQITSPTANLVIGANLGFVARVHVAGRVSGEGLTPTVRLGIHLPLPPESHAPDRIVEVPLAGSGNNRTFSINPEVTLGLSTFTLTATNIAGLTATAEAHVTYLPDVIRLRFQHDGGTGTFGNLRYGWTEDHRQIAMYDRGAISLQGSATMAVRGAIFNKWASLREPGSALPRLGAPVTEQQASLAGATAQDFSGGRIYAGLPSGAHYVPSVFVDAINRLGGESSIGVPTGDPTHSDDAMLTWQFQRFIRPDFPHFLPSTLELRGSPPRLYVESQGGYAHELKLAGVPAQELAQELFVPDSPTIWYTFPCADFNGPCTVAAPTSGPPIDNAGTRYCEGTTYPNGPPSWAAVRGHYRATPIIGIVKASHLADWDNPLSHELSNDWNVILHPLNPYRNLLRRGQSTLEIEFEEIFVLHFFVGQNGQPARGDLVFASGRWIIDCAHDDYNAEIHPPFVLARMRTVAYQGTQATEANIWVNGWFPGDPVEFDIYPPPRPSARATLNLVKPVDQDAALDVTVAANVANTGDHVHARFSASRRHVPVMKSGTPFNPLLETGEMKWQSGRKYEGTWHVYWSTH
jgi:LGFP repeat